MEDSINELNKLVDKGKIRSLGVCNFGVDDLNEILNLGVFSTDQLPYNLLWRPIEEEILPECKKNADEVPDGISRSRLFNKNRPLSNHDDEGCENEVFKCINKIQEIAKTLGENSAKISLSWVRQQSNITSLLVGARNTKELEMNLSAFEYDLSTELLKELSDLTNNVKLYLGKNPDMWKSDNRMR